jgi:hypothetical protein
MENLALTTPVVTPEVVVPASTKNSVAVAAVTMDLVAVDAIAGEPGILYIVVKDDSQALTSFTYSGAVAVTMIQTLNVADCTTKSMHKRILEKLVADGKLPAGTVEGAPSGANPTGEL